MTMRSCRMSDAVGSVIMSFKGHPRSFHNFVLTMRQRLKCVPKGRGGEGMGPLPCRDLR
jgi:hypothetical protein